MSVVADVGVVCAAGVADDACPGGEAGLLQPESKIASKTQQDTIRFLWKIMRGLSLARNTVSRIASPQITLIRKTKPVKRRGTEELGGEKFESSANGLVRVHPRLSAVRFWFLRSA